MQNQMFFMILINQIKLIYALFLPLNSNLYLQRSFIKYNNFYPAITRSNQRSSVPGPADYVVKKPLHQTATIAQTSQTRNLYKNFEPNPGPGTYEPKSYITVKNSLFRME